MMIVGIQQRREGWVRAVHVCIRIFHLVLWPAHLGYEDGIAVGIIPVSRSRCVEKA